MSPLVDFCVAFGILIIMMAYYGFVPTLNVIFLPLLVVFAMMTSLAVGLWLSALNVKYRDFQYTVPFLIHNLDVCITGCISGEYGSEQLRLYR